MKSEKVKYALSGAVSGAINGFFGAGGGMLLVPLLTRWAKLDEKRAFATSVAVILPLSAVSAAVCFIRAGIDLVGAVPYLIGGLLGGFVGGKTFSHVPATVLRKLLAAFILYGGVRGLFPDLLGGRDFLSGAWASSGIVSFIAAACTGVLSGWGVGGGTLLVIFMTLLQDIPQYSAQGINLLYFLPTSSSALVTHFKNGMIDKKAAALAAVCGTLAAAATAFLAAAVDIKLLKTVFSVFLLITGVSELFRKKGKAQCRLFK